MNERITFSNVPDSVLFILFCFCFYVFPSSMNRYPAPFKHYILTQYQPHSRGNGFKSLARKYDITGGGATIKYWYDRWNGGAESLESKPSTGRPSILSSEEIHQYIGTHIKRKNRNSKPVHYTDLFDSIQEKTGKRMSLRTIQRYGKEKEGVKGKRTKKRTTKERRRTYIL
jgi:hypothetical protein